MTQIFHEGKVVGTTQGDVYISQRKPEHFMRKFQGFGISLEVIKQLIEMKIEKVMIIYKGAKGVERWMASLDQFIKSEKKHYFEAYDLQHFVSTKEMMIV